MSAQLHISGSEDETLCRWLETEITHPQNSRRVAVVNVPFTCTSCPILEENMHFSCQLLIGHEK